MTRHGAYSYAYDANNRLTSVTPISGGNTIKYLYDPSGLLIRRTGDTTKAAFHWDGQNLARIDYTGSTTYALSFTYDPAGKPLTVNRHSASGTSTYYYRTNMRGDVLDIADSSGTKVASYSYDPWGTITDSWSATGQSIKDDNPLRYAGYIYDSSTGLYYLRARWYAPSIARFMTRDPFEGVADDPQSSNRYSYGGGNPATEVDPSGLSYLVFTGSYLNIYRRSRDRYTRVGHYRARTGDPRTSWRRFGGPIPPGTWWVYWWGIRRSSGAWGPWRVALRPYSRYGRYGVYIHSGPWRDTVGCIRTTDEGVRAVIAELLWYDPNGIMPLYVQY